MKPQRREYWLWMPFLLILFSLFSIFVFYPCCMAGRRRPYTDDTPNHDFPYETCSLRVIDADVRDVLRAFADKYKLSIIMNSEVKGKISIIVNKIPVKEAFESILGYANLGYIREGNVYRIKPLENLLKQETINQQVEELKTEIISLQHANAERLIPNLSKLKSNLPEAVIEADKWTNSVMVRDTAQKIEEIKAIIKKLDIPEPTQEIKELAQTTKVIKLHYLNCEDIANIKALKGKVSAHKQSNSVIITDSPQNIARLVSIVRDLDKPICQILIEAKIVETNKSYSHSLGVQWGGHYNDGPPSGKSFPSVSIGGAMGGTNYNGTNANYAVNLPGSQLPYGGVDFMLGHLKDRVALNLRLSAMEDSGKGRIISQPRIMTLDNTEAMISSGETIQLPPETNGSTTIVTGGNRSYSSNDTEKDATTKLTVTPHIISDNQIKLIITINRDTPDYSRPPVNDVPIIITREAKTELIVSNGETAVIGGLATTGVSNQETGIPWLNKIPVFGWLFKSKAKKSDYGELLVFITPHIVQAQN